MWLKCIIQTPIHPSNGDSSYSPFLRGINESLKRRFTLQKPEGELPFEKGELKKGE
jgi:hypothetical protein